MGNSIITIIHHLYMERQIEVTFRKNSIDVSGFVAEIFTKFNIIFTDEDSDHIS